MSSSYTFKWPAGPQEVIVTGTFNSWGQKLPLVKQTDGSFEITVPLEKKDTYYKYVVDGEWLTSDDQKKQKDANGFENNFLSADDLHVTSNGNGSKIPEAGGLVAATGSSGAATNSSGPELSTTVMPKTETKQQILGEPGIFIPKDKDTLAAFEKVEDVDSRKLSPAEKKKQKKKLKKIQYKARKKQKAAVGKLGQAGAGSESTSVSPEPEAKAVEPEAKEVKETGLGAEKTVHESVIPVPAVTEKAEEPTSVEPVSEAKSVSTKSVVEAPVVEAPASESKAVVDTPAVEEKSEAPTTSKAEETVPEDKSVSEKEATDGHPEVTVLATTEIIENIVIPVVAPHEQLDSAPVEEKEAAVPDVENVDFDNAAVSVDESEFKSLSDNTSVNPSILAVHQANVVPTVVGTPDIPSDEIQREQPKTLAPEPVSKSISDSQVPTSAVTEESQNTLDPTVVGVIGANAAEQQSANAVAKSISQEKQPKRTIEPAITQPIEPEQNKTEGDVKKLKDTPESVLAAPIKPLGAKEVEASPVHENTVTEEIIITQGGDDVNAIEEKIIAAESGPVSVEQIQPTESEARELAEEAHIPESTLGLDKKSKKASGKDKKVKEKKKSGFMAKLKKIFK